MKAYIDESGRNAAPGLYVLAGVVVRADQRDEVRAVLRSGLRHKRHRFHWREEEHTDQEAMAKLVGALRLASVVAVAAPVDAKRPERARRLCLTRLLWELEHRNVRDVLLESRGGVQDRQDRQHIANAQRARHLHTGLAFAFGDPKAGPLLWLPDLVAGAVSRARFDHLDCCLQLLGQDVTILDAGDGT